MKRCAVSYWCGTARIKPTRIVQISPNSLSSTACVHAQHVGAIVWHAQLLDLLVCEAKGEKTLPRGILVPAAPPEMY